MYALSASIKENISKVVNQLPNVWTGYIDSLQYLQSRIIS